MRKQIGGREERRWRFVRKNLRERFLLFGEAGQQQFAFGGENLPHAHGGGETRDEITRTVGGQFGVGVDGAFLQGDHTRRQIRKVLDGNGLRFHRFVEGDMAVEADAEQLQIQTAGGGQRVIKFGGIGRIREVGLAFRKVPFRQKTVEEVVEEAEVVEEPEVEETVEEAVEPEPEPEPEPSYMKNDIPSMDFSMFSSDLFPHLGKSETITENKFNEVAMNEGKKLDEKLLEEEAKLKEAEALLASLGIKL